MVDENEDKHYDRVFDYLASRVSSRESASISVVSLASSASLIFLAIIFTKDEFYWESFIIGIIFPAVAYAYNEITNRGLHQDDQNAINDLIEKTDPTKWKKETEKIIKNENRRYLRRVMMRLAFLIPILAWLLTLPIQLKLDLNSKIMLDISF